MDAELKKPAAVGWAIYEGNAWGSYKHVVPVNDLREHVRSRDCWCKPRVDLSICVHNSADQRELFEPDHKQ